MFGCAGRLERGAVGNRTLAFLSGDMPPGRFFKALSALALFSGPRKKESLYDRLNESIVLPSKIVDFYPDPTLAIDNSGRIVAWNKAMEDMTGVPAESMLGKSNHEYAIPFYGEPKTLLVDLVGLPEEKICDRYTNVVVRNGRLEASTIRAKLRGKEAVLWGVASKLEGMDGTAVGAIECIRDITELAHTEEMLRQHEEKYRLITTSINDGIVTIDLNGMITFANPSAQAMCGHSLDEILGHDFTDFVAEEYRDQAVELLKRGIAGKDTMPGEIKTSPCEMEIKSKDGGHVPIEMNGSYIRTNGKVNGIIVAFHDITARKKAEEAQKLAHDSLELRVEERTAELARARGLLQAIIDTIPSGIVVADAITGLITYSNQEIARIFGGDVIGTNSFSGPWQFVLMRQDHSPIKPEDMPLSRSLRRGEHIYDFEAFVRRTNGKEFAVIISSAPILGDDGRIVGAVANAIDITERKEAEKELKNAKEQAELYLDLMGHDINNMNQVAIGYLELAGDKLHFGEEEKHMILKPLEMLMGSSKLIDNVRKIQLAMGSHMKLEAVDASLMLAEVSAEYSLVAGRAVNIRYDPAVQCIVMANPLLKDVFSNIVGNAVKHSSGSLDIFIDVHLIREYDKKFYRITVEDNGPGIPDDLKPQLFSRAMRGRTKAKGMGLGLYLVKTLVEGFHGKVWVENRVAGDYSKGSRFVIVLPAAPIQEMQ